MRFRCYLKSANISFTINFIAFDFIIFFGLNSNPDNLVKVLFKASLIESLMCLNISLRALKKLKSSLSGSIRINFQSSSCSMAFCFLNHSQFLCCCVNFYQSLLGAYSHENTSQSDDLKHHIWLAYFLFQMNSVFL